MLLRIDFESEIPIYEQIQRQIVQGIASGEIERGENLPSVRQMAEDIGINLHTVNKAYNNLKMQGYLTIDRRKGAMVNYDFPQKTDNVRENLNDELKYIIAECKCRGFTKEEFLKICEKIFNNYNK